MLLRPFPIRLFISQQATLENLLIDSPNQDKSDIFFGGGCFTPQTGGEMRNHHGKQHGEGATGRYREKTQ